MLVVDDEPLVSASIATLLESEGYHVTTASSAAGARSIVEQDARTDSPVQVVLTDFAMPGETGLELVKSLRETHPSIACVVLTGYGTIESAVDSIRSGAFDYLSKPVVDEELRLALERAGRQQVLLAENQHLKDELRCRKSGGSVVGSDYRMAKAMELVDAVAPSSATVLITGESGTGKSLIARSLHDRSSRSTGPFVELHCGSIPETLLESELFGHVKGAFTGAHTDKEGKFTAADGGTIFLDEINSSSPGMQLKLLRVIQERCFEPVGSTETVQVDVRVILATNQPLEPLVASGSFRQDLYYRVNVVNIELPPLRDRPSDVIDLAEHFLERFAARHNRTIIGFDEDARSALMRYPFPGNVRELENAIERAVVLAETPTVRASHLPPHIAQGQSPMSIAVAQQDGGSLPVDLEDGPWEPIPLSEALEEPEKRILLKALQANEWNRQRTADDLAINRTTLYKKIKQYGLDKLAG